MQSRRGQTRAVAASSQELKSREKTTANRANPLRDLSDLFFVGLMSRNARHQFRSRITSCLLSGQLVTNERSISLLRRWQKGAVTREYVQRVTRNVIPYRPTKTATLMEVEHCRSSSFSDFCWHRCWFD